jgi:endogenous inhibitor of DNA gyrase (YacG/DUF329 family)
MKCPICHKEVAPNNPEFPFCSERCRLVDLGNWASGKYVISTPLNRPRAPRDQEPQNEDEE